MQNLYYTIRVNGDIVAKAESTVVASVIAQMYGKYGKEVKVINNVYNRIAFNNKRTNWSAGWIEDHIKDNDEKFRLEYCEKNDVEP